MQQAAGGLLGAQGRRTGRLHSVAEPQRVADIAHQRGGVLAQRSNRSHGFQAAVLVSSAPEPMDRGGAPSLALFRGSSPPPAAALARAVAALLRPRLVLLLSVPRRLVDGGGGGLCLCLCVGRRLLRASALARPGRRRRRRLVRVRVRVFVRAPREQGQECGDVAHLLLVVTGLRQGDRGHHPAGQVRACVQPTSSSGW